MSTPVAPSSIEPATFFLPAVGATPDFSQILFLAEQDLVPSDADSRILDLFVNGEDGLTWISQGPLGGTGTGASKVTPYEVLFGGASPDLAHVLFETYGHLTNTDTHSSGNEIYDRVGFGATDLVGVLPNGSVPACGASLGDQEAGSAPSKGSHNVGAYNAVSQSGTVVVFQSPDLSGTSPGASCPSPPPQQLYVRRNDQETIEASAPAPRVTDPHGEQEAHYAFSTPSGNAVFFTGQGALTANANTDGDTAEDLYEYEVGTHSLTDVSSEGLTDPRGSLVQGVLGVSENATVVYFVAQGKLTGDATSGKDNLYVSDAGQLTYVAALGSSDRADWEGVIQGRSARIAPDGSHLLFSSTESLTSYSNAGKAELYLYSLGSPTLICVSCGSAGTTPTSSATFGGSVTGTAWPPPYNLSADGSTVFFDSSDPLAPGSGTGASNIYEWRDGTVSLISPEAEFLDATPSGSDVFFKTTESLIPADEDGGEPDIYDARVDGGFPAPPKEEEGCNSNDSCKGVGTSLAVLSPASLTQTGIGNYIAPKAGVLTAKETKKKTPTRSEQLSKALAKCKKLKASKRKACEKAARKKLSAKPKKKSKSKKKGK